MKSAETKFTVRAHSSAKPFVSYHMPTNVCLPVSPLWKSVTNSFAFHRSPEPGWFSRVPLRRPGGEGTRHGF